MDENVTFSKSNLNHNHQEGDFVLEEKLKRHEMIAPKGSISKDTWKRISRSIDDIESIYVSVSKKLGLESDETYRDTDCIMKL